MPGFFSPIRYPSISKDLLMNAINLAKSITPIDDKIITTILHRRKLLLPHKKWNLGYFLYMVSKEFRDNNIGLYRNDGLSCFQNFSGPESEKILRQHGFNITVECNLWITGFLNVIFDLRTRNNYPYRKVNNELLYIHKQSNHSTIYHQAISCHYQ